jgi:hypothetical protein
MVYNDVCAAHSSSINIYKRVLCFYLTIQIPTVHLWLLEPPVSSQEPFLRFLRVKTQMPLEQLSNCDQKSIGWEDYA